MNDHRNNGVGVWAAVILTIILAIPPGYLLLLGPVLRLVSSGTLSWDHWEVVAKPAIYVAGFFDGKPEWFWGTYEEGYLRWWAPGP
jgi:hypothetical protein